MSIATNSFRTYIFRIAMAISGVFIGIFIARFLGPAGKGYYSGIFLFYSTYIAVFGTIGTAITYQITRRKEPPKAVFFTASVYSGLIGLGTIFIFGLYTIFHPTFEPGAIWLVVIITPCTLIITNITGLLQGLDRITALNWVGMIAGLFQLILLSSGFLGFPIKVETAIQIWFLAQLLTLSIALWFSRKYWWFPVKTMFNLPLLMSMLGFGWQISLNSMIGILNSRIDSFLVLTYLKTKEYGLYSVAVNGAEILWYASGAIAVAICAHVGKAESERAAQLTAKAARHTLLINIPLAALMWSAAWLIPLVYGKGFSASMVPFRILLPGILAYSTASIFSTFFTNQLGQPKIPLMVAFISFTIDLVGCKLMIPRLGMIGGALANTISYLGSISILIFLFCRKTKFSLADLFLVTKDDLADYQHLGRKIVHFFSFR